MTREQETVRSAGRRRQPGARSMMGRRAERAAIAAIAAATAVASLPAGGAAASVTGAAGQARTPATPAATLLAWGDNGNGQLGDGSPVPISRVPVKVRIPAGNKITSVRSGCDFSVALTAAGRVLAWGADNVGQLGNGTEDSVLHAPEPVKLPAGTKVKAVRGACDFGLALTTTGRVLAWGSNTDGQLGNFHMGGSVDTPAPVVMAAGDPVTAITAGAAHALALTRSGRVLAWGANQDGQLGDGVDGNDADGPVLVHVPTGAKVTGIAAGQLFSMALTAGGKMLAWGDDEDGQLGDGMPQLHRDVPVAVRLPKGTRVRSMTDGCADALALTTGGKMLAWGDNSEGELGTGQGLSHPDTTPAAVKIPAGTKVTAISASCGTGHALTSKGQILSWGGNAFGELGTGSTADLSKLPVRVKLPAGRVATSLGAGPETTSSFAIVH